MALFRFSSRCVSLHLQSQFVRPLASAQGICSSGDAIRAFSQKSSVVLTPRSFSSSFQSAPLLQLQQQPSSLRSELQQETHSLLTFLFFLSKTSKPYCVQ